ncbi:hypothetical protein FY034_00515 [Trichlorobacter lovleyi]|uniref:hypothetical protein n=1 Tax=Trichlorobacter lovleyi TaxID=313985 RepID=UPI0022400BEF|nr:hypothetical protein [Trichlorobacter lovleyi]QOX77485.1 hypothetical protein FY034_00515 [Trichlorobacter lovleyi]
MALKQLLTAALLLMAASGNGAADTPAALPEPPRVMLLPAELPEYLAKRPDGTLRDVLIPPQDRPWYLQVIQNMAIATATNNEQKQNDGRPRTPTTQRP